MIKLDLLIRITFEHALYPFLVLSVHCYIDKSGELRIRDMGNDVYPIIYPIIIYCLYLSMRKSITSLTRIPSG